MQGSNRKAVKIAVPFILCICIAALVMITIFSATAYIAQPVVIVVNAISIFFSSLNITETSTGISIEKALENWQAEQGAQLEAGYSSECTSFYLAEAVSFYYYDQTGKDIVVDGNWRSYLDCFSTADQDTIYALIKDQYGYAPDEETRQNISSLTAHLISAKVSRSVITDLDDLGFNGSTGCTAPEDTEINPGDPLNDFIWQQAYSIGGGNPFYYAAKAGLWDPRQCTTFAWYRFYQYYGYDSGARGSGYIDAEQVAAAHPDKFILSSTPAAGAIMSCPRTFSMYGHVAFVEKVEDTAIWISDGNWTPGSIRLNKKTSVQDINSLYCKNGEKIKYTVPK